ncbi:hypothetical protein KUBF_11640 [Bacteroides finegoldii]|nr:hypothetical protein KUBF_11640 [Bacteroides finegoldii]
MPLRFGNTWQVYNLKSLYYENNIIKRPLSVHFGMGEYADRISAGFTGNGEKFVGHQ